MSVSWVLILLELVELEVELELELWVARAGRDVWTWW